MGVGTAGFKIPVVDDALVPGAGQPGVNDAFLGWLLFVSMILLSVLGLALPRPSSCCFELFHFPQYWPQPPNHHIIEVDRKSKLVDGLPSHPCRKISHLMFISVYCVRCEILNKYRSTKYRKWETDYNVFAYISFVTNHEYTEIKSFWRKCHFGACFTAELELSVQVLRKTNRA